MKKDILIIIGVALVAVIIGIIVLLPGLRDVSVLPATPAGEGQLAAVSVPFSELLKGKQTAIPKRVNYAITSSEQLAELWRMIGAEGVPPTIDFSVKTVIAVFAGTASSSDIAVMKVEDTNARLVSVVIKQPETSCVVASEGMPYEIVVMPTTSLPLAHADNVATVSCPTD